MIAHRSLHSHLAFTLGLVFAACVQSHQPPQPCDPSVDGACPTGQVCRETWEGDHLCMEICDDLDYLVCADGATCAYRAPGRERVCWTGGDRESGEECSHVTECSFGLTCNRLGVCEQACGSYDFECETPGYRCIHSACQPPIPRNTPCATPGRCDPYYVCDPETLFTCQPTCMPGGTCYDGTSCNERDLAVRCSDDELPRFDSCERTSEGSTGCGEDEVCVLTEVGVRRCVRGGCTPDGSGELGCGGAACLPDPEDPDTFVCWPGGSVLRGEPCTNDYECDFGNACNSAGACAFACEVEGAPCVTLPGHVCRDFVCTPEG